MLFALHAKDQPDDIRTDQLTHDHNYNTGTERNRADRYKRRTASNRVIDTRRAGVLIGDKNRPFVIGNVAFLIQLTGHNSCNVRAGEAGDKGDAAFARNTHQRTKQRTEHNVRRLESAELLKYAKQAAKKHNCWDQVKAGHEAVLRAGAARTDQIGTRFPDRAKRAGEVGKV